MSVLFVALPLAILLGGAAMLACVACIRRGQFDDLETPAVRILIDDRPQPVEPAANTSAGSSPPGLRPDVVVVSSGLDPTDNPRARNH